MIKNRRIIKEVADRLRVSPRTVYREMAEGRLPYITYRNRRLVTDEAIERLVIGGS